ncbi:MAG TPA: polymer-forming cytoskeletal protein [Gammaproteobacteria bacterium]|jgi:cytoskeletal protein CcmA (bactofilin family)
MFERGKKDEPGQRQGVEPEAAPWNESARGNAPAREAAVIGRSIQIDGNLRGEEDLRIEGDVSGTIQLNNHSLTIGKDGKIKADVHAKVITVDGNMDGDLYGSERVSIRKTARVIGNIVAPRVSLEDGARFKGSIEMDPEAVDAVLGKSQSAPKPASAVTPTIVAKPAAVAKV